MKFSFFLSITIFCIMSLMSTAQNNYNCIVFQSIYEYRDNDTLNDYDFDIVIRDESEFFFMGGPEYGVLFLDRKAQKKFRKEYVWGVVNDSVFYINNLRFSKNPGFNEVEYQGQRYLLMMGLITKREEKNINYLNYNSSGLIDGIRDSGTMRIGIAYDIIENKFYYLNEKGIKKLFNSRPNELKEYELLIDKEDYHSIFNIIEKIDNTDNNRP